MSCRRPTRTFFILLCLCILLPPPQANGTTEGEGDLAAPIRRHKINIGKLRQEIRIHLDKIRESGEQEVSLLEELRHIDEKLAARRQKLATLQHRLQAQEELLALKEQDLQQAEQVRENVRRHLEKRLRAFYLMGKTGFLNVTFSSKSLPDLMLFNDSFRQLLDYDQSVIEMYHQTIEQLERAREAQELEKSLLQDFIAQAEKEKQALDDIRREKETLLSRIKSKKGLYEQAVREMQRAEKELTATLIELKKKKENRTRGFALNKGKLAGPVIGRLTVRFGERLDNGPSRGISVETAGGAPVYAVYSGKVIFAGYRKGYGNMVIIDHGMQYYTITARLDEIDVKEGSEVRPRERIGTTGDIATLFSRGLYFEIRHGSEPLDPLDWLQKNFYPELVPLPVPQLPEKESGFSTAREYTLPPNRPPPAEVDKSGSEAAKTAGAADDR